MTSLNLQRDVGLLTLGLDSAEAVHQIYEQLSPLLSDSDANLVFDSYEAFEKAVVGWHLCRHLTHDLLLERARQFFLEVDRVAEFDGDVLYDFKPGAGVFSVGCAVFLDYHDGYAKMAERVALEDFSLEDVEDAEYAARSCDVKLFPGLSDEDLVTVASWYSRDIDQAILDLLAVNDELLYVCLSDSLGVEIDDVLAAYALFSDSLESGEEISGYDWAETIRLYVSKDLSWLSQEERMAVVTESFDYSHIVQKHHKFMSFFPQISENYDSIVRQYLSEPLEEGGQQRYLSYWDDTTDMDEQQQRALLDVMVDWTLYVVLIESEGRGTNIMQLGDDEFDEYGPEGGDITNPEHNLKAGTNYLFGYCLGSPRNPGQTIIRAIANYNMGAGAVGGYRLGQGNFTETTKNYLRDFLIYERVHSEQKEALIPATLPESERSELYALADTDL